MTFPVWFGTVVMDKTSQDQSGSVDCGFWFIPTKMKKILDLE